MTSTSADRTELEWLVGYHDSRDNKPDTFFPATVPGAVQLDWAKATGQPEYWKAENPKLFEWAENSYWTYKTNIDLSRVANGSIPYFVCGGVDYQFEVKIEGTTVHSQEGMFTPFELSLENHIGKRIQIEILVYPAPDSGDDSTHHSVANACSKPPVSWGWDWHPRLVPLGIWKDTFIEERPSVHLFNLSFETRLDENCQRATLTINTESNQPTKLPLNLTLRSPSGAVAHQSTLSLASGSASHTVTIENPELWWPNEHGPQSRYELIAELQSGDGTAQSTLKKRVGFRRIRLVMHEGAWDEPSTFPKGRSNPPITLEVNGRSIFCKGTNWVPPEIFPGIIDQDTYRPLLEMAQKAHFNLLRNWGGGIINKESFFDQCDELGLMVWQEFPIACNRMSEEDHYLETLNQESKSIIEAGRQHPCLAIWCGGNELFNAWSMMTDQHPALRLLNRNCYDLDPRTPFLPTSPVMGMAHGHYVFRDQSNGEEVYSTFGNANNTAYTEYGCPGPSDVEYLKTFIPEDELFPPQASGSWKAHHAFGAWGVEGDSWLCPSVIDHYFGKPQTLEELVKYGQLLQAQGYKFIYEEARRQKPVCSMALNWCYNEPWPSAANNSLINWPHRPKPAYHAVAESCRPVLLSASVSKFQWSEGETFVCNLWLLNDHHEAIEGGQLEAQLVFPDQTIQVLQWTYPEIEANKNLAGPSARWELPKCEQNTFDLKLVDTRNPERNSVYTFAYKKAEAKDSGPRAMNQ
ncbi:glycoside hydrolase family 2 protein [Pelagicoccus mobilis]|uniref:beta-mannosidase n=1 Tax=Pelagicoccus mobilis TaxID=415221 RepID=A0A934RU72_9BACT|nr:hypothetical protein [Pelagicoccus mobilis]MBK1875490.1 hypothetical protein [Pelagicoccus mobilis]